MADKAQEIILSKIEEIDNQIKELSRQRGLLEKQVEKLYYVQNIRIENAPLIICHGTEAHCRKYMLEHYSDGHWYYDSNQFSPIDNPDGINWAILSSVNKAKKRDWERVQAYINNPNQETAWGLVAMWKG